jgi:hypothetical protein
MCGSCIGPRRGSVKAVAGRGSSRWRTSRHPSASGTWPSGGRCHAPAAARPAAFPPSHRSCRPAPPWLRPSLRWPPPAPASASPRPWTWTESGRAAGTQIPVSLGVERHRGRTGGGRRRTPRRRCLPTDVTSSALQQSSLGRMGLRPERGRRSGGWLAPSRRAPQAQTCPRWRWFPVRALEMAGGARSAPLPPRAHLRGVHDSVHILRHWRRPLALATGMPEAAAYRKARAPQAVV